MYRYLVAIMLCLSMHHACSEAPREIRVQLFGDSTLAALYLPSIQVKDSSFSSSYLEELHRVFMYDAAHNGKTLPSVQEKSPYSCTMTVEQKTLYAHIRSSSIHVTESIALTGTLGVDKRYIHELHDLLLHKLFHERGIASTKILYSTEVQHADGAWKAEIAECDWDGDNPRLLTEEQSYCITPVVVPKDAHFHKELFLYVSYKTGQPKILIAAKGEKKGKRVVDIRGNQMLPSISKQRKQLAFICDASGRTDLFIQAIDPETGRTGVPRQLFSYPRSTQASPVFHPDGSKLAFVSDKDGTPRIYWISTHHSDKRPTAHMITKKQRENSCPAWSPDGTKLAYSAKTDGVRQIWIYDFALQEERQLTSGPGNKENPCWAQNSLHIVFNSTDGNYSDLYVVNLNQQTAIKITKGQGKKHYPSWDTR